MGTIGVHPTCVVQTCCSAPATPAEPQLHAFSTLRVKESGELEAFGSGSYPSSTCSLCRGASSIMGCSQTHRSPPPIIYRAGSARYVRQKGLRQLFCRIQSSLNACALRVLDCTSCRFPFCRMSPGRMSSLAGSSGGLASDRNEAIVNELVRST